MTAGESVGGSLPTPYDAPPSDTGEALGLNAAGLTLTFGFGPTLFERTARTGSASQDRQPAALRELPHFPADNLDPARSNGDLCVQACAHDPQVAVHAIRNLARIGFGTVALRWAQLGFGRTSSTSTEQVTPRNLLGFKDGTANLKAEDSRDVEKFVWVAEGDDARADWLAGGSYLVARRINMHIEPWDRTSLREQETLIGRDREEGAPLSGGTEFTEPDFDAAGPRRSADRGRRARAAGPPEHRTTACGCCAAATTSPTAATRSAASTPGCSSSPSCATPTSTYIPMQTQLSGQDALMEYLQHTGSGLFAVPPGVQSKDGWIGEGLFA